MKGCSPLDRSLQSISLSFIRCNSRTSSKRWLDRQMNDKFTKDSKTSNYRSRAAFKLIEIDKKFHIFNKKTLNIVDLGFAPGAWTQVALERSIAVGIKSNVIGIDLINCNPPEGSHFVQGDVFQNDTQQIIRDYFEKLQSKTFTTNTTTPAGNENVDMQLPVDLILSDMMANTSGIKDSDHFASMDLCNEALRLSTKLLRPKGNIVMKFYTGKEENMLKNDIQTFFTKVYRFKPASCRRELKEMYFIGMNKK